MGMSQGPSRQGEDVWNPAPALCQGPFMPGHIVLTGRGGGQVGKISWAATGTCWWEGMSESCMHNPQTPRKMILLSQSSAGLAVPGWPHRTGLWVILGSLPHNGETGCPYLRVCPGLLHYCQVQLWAPPASLRVPAPGTCPGQ